MGAGAHVDEFTHHNVGDAGDAHMRQTMNKMRAATLGGFRLRRRNSSSPPVASVLGMTGNGQFNAARAV